MVDQARSAVLLYVHPLLGEGIAAYVRAQTGATVAAIPVTDKAAVAHALLSDPSVVVFEESPGLGRDELSRLAPGATLIDVSAASASGDQIPAQGTAPCVETIVSAIEHDATPHAC